MVKSVRDLLSVLQLDSFSQHSEEEMDDSEAESAEREESYLVNVERGGLEYLEIPPEKVRKIRN